CSLGSTLRFCAPLSFWEYTLVCEGDRREEKSPILSPRGKAGNYLSSRSVENTGAIDRDQLTLIVIRLCWISHFKQTDKFNIPRIWNCIPICHAKRDAEFHKPSRRIISMTSIVNVRVHLYFL